MLNCSQPFEYFQGKLLLAVVFLFATNLPAVAGPSTGDDTFFGEPGLAITPFSQANRLLAQSGSAPAGDSASAAAAPSASVGSHHGSAAEIGAKLSNPVSDVWALFTTFGVTSRGGDLAKNPSSAKAPTFAVWAIKDPESGKDGRPKPAQTDYGRLEGKWLRPDGGYVLKLSDVTSEGKLKAAYFNPRPINVGKAEWQSMNDRIQVFVELQDVNYPGSTYRLIYDPEHDRLNGYYYQAVAKETFDVIFVRTK